MTIIARKEGDSDLMKSRTAIVTAALVAAGSAALLIVLVFFSRMTLNWDCAVFLQCAKLLLRGNMPYVDYVELNPPMAQYVNVLPVLVAKLLDTDVAMTFQVLVLGLVLWSAAMLLFITVRSQAIKTWTGRFLIAAAWLSFSILVFSDGGFGQREHLFAVAFGPWLYARMARHCGVALPSWITIPVGLFGGMFILLKPHFLFVAVVAEIWLLYCSRRWSTLRAIEIYLFTGIGVAYGLSLVAIAPLRNAFFGRWLPFIAANYSGYNNPLEDALWHPWLGNAFWTASASSFLVAFSATWFAPKSKNQLQIGALSFSFISGVAIYLIQHKGWSYHLYPAVGLLSLLAVASCVILLESQTLVTRKQKETSENTEGAWRAILLAGCLLNLIVVVGEGIRTTKDKSQYYHKKVYKYVEYMLNNSQENDRVMFVDTSDYPYYSSTILANRLPAGKFPIAFPIAFFYDKNQKYRKGISLYPRPSGLTAKEKQFITNLGKDILRDQPKLIFIQAGTRCEACPAGFNVYDYLKHIEWTNRYLKKYELVGQIEKHVIYQREGM